jgi:hypothetical protein
VRYKGTRTISYEVCIWAVIFAYYLNANKNWKKTDIQVRILVSEMKFLKPDVK